MTKKKSQSKKSYKKPAGLLCYEETCMHSIKGHTSTGCCNCDCQLKDTDYDQNKALIARDTVVASLKDNMSNLNDALDRLRTIDERMESLTTEELKQELRALREKV